jgi:hypothetical protein
VASPQSPREDCFGCRIPREKTVLARCTTPFYRINLIQPGINLGRKDQKISDFTERDISEEIDSSPQYFSSQKEYQIHTAGKNWFRH